MKKIISSVLLLSFISLNSYANWVTFRGGPTNSGRSEKSFDEFSSRSEQKVNSFKTNGLIWGSAVEDEEGNIYVGSADKYFYAFNSDFKLLWQYKIFDRADSLIDSAALITSTGLVIIPGGDGYLHAVDKTSGEKKWVFKASDASDDSHSSGVIVNSFEGNVTEGPNGLIYAGNDNGHMYCLDQNGTMIWSLKTNMMIWSMPAFFKQHELMVFGSLDKHLYLVSTKDGSVMDKFKASGEIKASPSLNADDIYFGDSQGKFYSLSIKQTRKGFKFVKNWSKNTKGEIYSSAANKLDYIMVGSLDGHLYAFDQAGNIKWKFNAFSPISSSPVVTADNKVIFGSRSGKIYALDMFNGERYFSFRTSNKIAKVNLDASPLITKNGFIVNGSYSGLIYRIPLEYCFRSNDSKCEFGGKEDQPDYVRGLADGIHFLVQDAAGDFVRIEKYEYKYPEVLKLKIIKMENGSYQSNIGINSLNLKLSSDLFKVYLSSDDEIINLRPIAKINGRELNFKVKGEVYTKNHWFFDRFKFFCLENFASNIAIKIANNPGSNYLKNIIAQEQSIFVDALYLFQPKSLDTYIPAALDGQAFKIDFFNLDEKSNKVKAIVTPATMTDKNIKVLSEPSKVIILNGDITENGLELSGEFKISAMGGTISFDLARFTMRFDDERFYNQEFFMIAKCLNLKGNGANYSFSPTLIVETCDSRLRLIAAGRFETNAIEYQLPVDYRLSEIKPKLFKLNVSFPKEAEVVVTIMDNKQVKHIKMTSAQSTTNEIHFSKTADTRVFIDGKKIFDGSSDE